MDFTHVLRNIIEENGLNQSSFAKLIRIKQPQVSEWLSGKSKPGYDNLRAICIALNVSPSRLLCLPGNID